MMENENEAQLTWARVFGIWAIYTILVGILGYAISVPVKPIVTAVIFNICHVHADSENILVTKFAGGAIGSFIAGPLALRKLLNTKFAGYRLVLLRSI